MSKDLRKDFVLASTANYFGLDSGDASLAKLHGSVQINNFLDDGGCPLLVAWCDGTKGSSQVHFNNKVEQSGEKSQKTLVFVKLKPDPITPDNLHSNVFVSSMLDSPVMALYHSLHKVYAPMLLKDEKWSRMFDPKLQKLLSELDSSLGSVVRAQDSSGGSKGDDGNMTVFLVSDWLSKMIEFSSRETSDSPAPGGKTSDSRDMSIKTTSVRKCMFLELRFWRNTIKMQNLYFIFIRIIDYPHYFMLDLKRSNSK